MKGGIGGRGTPRATFGTAWVDAKMLTWIRTAPSSRARRTPSVLGEALNCPGCAAILCLALWVATGDRGRMLGRTRMGVQDTVHIPQTMVTGM